MRKPLLNRRDLFAATAILVAALAVYYPAAGFDFVRFDDDVLIYENSRVRQGLTWENFSWAFTSFENLNWMPLAWLSHMLDADLYGMNPGGHHLASLLLHTLSSLLLYFALAAMSRAPGRSFAVAVLFAVHPLHVESVAWVSARRDVLSGLFWMLALLAYERYSRRPRVLSYGAVTLFFSLGLMAKPIVVTLPAVLLILDCWPLGRLRQGETRYGTRAGRLRGLITEKIPLFVLAAAGGLAAYLAQEEGGAVQGVAEYPPALRILNALTSLFMYIRQTIWPVDLAMFYPYPESIPFWQGAGAFLVLAVITLSAYRLRGRLPALLAGWGWFLITLLPVVGLLQVGVQARADRYMYLPIVGLGIMAAWGIHYIAAAAGVRRSALAAAGAATLCLLGITARAQVMTWRNNAALFGHALEVDPDNWMAQNSYGVELYSRGEVEAAIVHYSKAVELRPTYLRARNNLGAALHRLGRPEEAVRHYEAALREDPESATVLYNYGLALRSMGDLSGAEQRLLESLRADPGYADAHHMAGRLLLQRKKPAEALKHLQRAVELRPDSDLFRVSLAWAHLSAGNATAAAEHSREALRLNPGNATARTYLDYALRRRTGDH